MLWWKVIKIEEKAQHLLGKKIVKIKRTNFQFTFLLFLISNLIKVLNCFSPILILFMTGRFQTFLFFSISFSSFNFEPFRTSSLWFTSNFSSKNLSFFHKITVKNGWTFYKPPKTAFFRNWPVVSSLDGVESWYFRIESGLMSFTPYVFYFSKKWIFWG